MTLRELADHVGCTPAAISQFEAASRHPTEAMVERMAEALAVPVPFLQAGEVDLLDSPATGAKSSPASFRALRSLSAKSRAKALAGGVIAAEISKVITKRLAVPPFDLPDLTGETPERAASLLRATWGIGDGPVNNMVHLLEGRGIWVFWTRNECREVDAFCFWMEGRPFVMLGNDKAPERSRRDAAHELGHLVLHRHGDVCGRQAEEEAERFASEFLTPAGQFMRECGVDPTDLRVSDLKRRWKVQRIAVIRRAFELGLMTEWHYRMECIATSQAGPVEQDAIDREQSSLFEKALSMLAELGISIEGIGNELHLPPEDVLNFVPLDRPERWMTNAAGARIIDWNGTRQRRGAGTIRNPARDAAEHEVLRFRGPGDAVESAPSVEPSEVQVTHLPAADVSPLPRLPSGRG